jgi:hypothetical protein
MSVKRHKDIKFADAIKVVNQLTLREEDPFVLYGLVQCPPHEFLKCGKQRTESECHEAGKFSMGSGTFNDVIRLKCLRQTMTPLAVETLFIECSLQFAGGAETGLLERKPPGR